jgi:hypothetical protein
MEVSTNPNWEELTKYLITDALSPSKEPLISSVEDIQISRDGHELTIYVHSTSKYGTISENKVIINE